METPAQGAPEYYVWTANRNGLEVHLRLNVIDAILAEMMRGFGAVPRRGAEVGGLLIGSIERGAGTVIHIDAFEAVECGYTRGPSYLFSLEERKTFEDACARLRPDAEPDFESNPEPKPFAVGFYRSHTRDGLALAPEDIELMDACLPDLSQVVLLVKPYAMKASAGGFFFREKGVFQETTPLEFPFRRRELMGEDAPEHRPLADRRPRESDARATTPAFVESVIEEVPVPEKRPEVPPPAVPPGISYGVHGADFSASSAKRSGGWVWVPMSVLFLLLGVALGYLARSAASGEADYSLALAVQKSGESLLLQWNNESPLILQAQRGVLEVHDGAYAKTLELDATHLRNGKLTLHNETGAVSFHLTVFLNSTLSVSEDLSWHQ